MRNSGFLWIIIAIMMVLDVYIFQAFKVILPASSPRLRMTLIILYWLISALALILLITFPYINFDNWPKALRTYMFALMVGFFFSQLVASIFFLVDDIRRVCTWIVVKLFSNPAQGLSDSPRTGITRSTFLSWLGFAMGGGLFSTLVYGFSNKYNYNVRKVDLSYPNLPAAFKGLKIVQISDVHSGSFMDKRAVSKGIDKILEQQPDLILFTGDLVNDRAVEMKNYIEVFSRLQAPMGVFSTLGNHDYGDYVRWETPEAKINNLENLKAVHSQLGWRLLMNENVQFERNGEAIALLGVENWSARRNFPKYGNLSTAYHGTEKIPFKILMTHDPSHWEGEVVPAYPDIDLTLSGHTHGMQFGVEIPGFRWSPVQYVYKQWAGLYESQAQKLYINRGFGFIGYPGRVGILPEITVITLT
jgi:predicted MPP superfamily phosphohydrolase